MESQEVRLFRISSRSIPLKVHIKGSGRFRCYQDFIRFLCQSGLFVPRMIKQPYAEPDRLDSRQGWVKKSMDNGDLVHHIGLTLPGSWGAPSDPVLVDPLHRHHRGSSHPLQEVDLAAASSPGGRVGGGAGGLSEGKHQRSGR